MQRSKKIFLLLTAIFFLILLLLAVDFSRKTTFPGHRQTTEPGGSGIADTVSTSARGNK